jgi:predicted Zn-dependent peptidase
MKQLGKIKNFPVTKKEFSMAKEYYKSGLLMALEDNMAAMMFFGEHMTAVDRITTKEEILKKLDEIEIDKLKEIAKAIFVDEALRLAVIGPQAEEDKEAIAQILHL